MASNEISLYCSCMISPPLIKGFHDNYSCYCCTNDISRLELTDQFQDLGFLVQPWCPHSVLNSTFLILLAPNISFCHRKLHTCLLIDLPLLCFQPLLLAPAYPSQFVASTKCPLPAPRAIASLSCSILVNCTSSVNHILIYNREHHPHS